MRIILLGPPGSGKGTQGELLEKKFRFPRVATGDLLRDAIQAGSEIGKRVEMVINRGELVPDELVLDLVKARVSADDCGKGYILDGFPRNLKQAEMLDHWSPDPDEIVINISLPDNLIVERLTSRRICSGCGKIFNLNMQDSANMEICDACSGLLEQRKDDNPGVILNRLRVYHDSTDELVWYYQVKKVYYEVDGNGSINKVFAQIQGILAPTAEKLRIHTES